MNRRNAIQTAAAGVMSASLAANARADEKPKTTNDIYMLVYPKFTALDLVGPMHVLSMLEGYKVKLVWKDTKELMTDTGMPTRATLAFSECVENPAVIFVPGGTSGTLAAMEDKEVREFLAKRGANAQYVTSVCTGSLVLGAAGLLKGYKATSHWLTVDTLKQFGAEPVADRVVIDRSRVTGAGVTAGIDFALTLAAKIKDEPYAKGIQLLSEYDPKPPYQCGHPKTADAETLTLIREMYKPFQTQLNAAVKRLNK